MTRHGVALVDKVGIECLCGATIPFNRGGWLEFNAHLSRAFEAVIAAVREGLHV